MTTQTRRALYGRLAGDTTLNGYLATPPAGWSKSIFHNQAPEGANYPFVVFAKDAGTPTDAFHQPGVFETDVWMVKGVDKSSSADNAEAIQARVIALLNDAVLSISGGTCLALRRQADVEYPEVIEGDSYHHAGALFRLHHA